MYIRRSQSLFNSENSRVKTEWVKVVRRGLFERTVNERCLQITVNFL